MAGGRPRKPTIIKFHQGTQRASRQKNEPQPEVIVKTPPPPRGLPPAGRRLWKREAKELVALGVLTTADLEAFEIGCTDYGLATELYRGITRVVEDVVIKKGKRKRTVKKVRYRSIDAFVNELSAPVMVDGILVQKPNIHERVAVINAMRGLHKDAMKVFSEFGLTPASRSRLDLPSDEKPGPSAVARMMNA